MLKYHDHQLTLQRGKAWRGSTPQVVTELKAAMCSAERGQLIRGKLQSIGFEWLAYGTLNYAPPDVTPKTFFASYANKGWTDRYFGERYYEVDPRHSYAPCSGLPLVWDMQDVASWIPVYPINARGKRFIDDFRASGIGCGILFSLTSPGHAKDRTVVSLTSNRPDRRWITDGVIGQALTLGFSIHEFLINHAPILTIPAGNGMALTPVQKDILHCVVSGLCDKEIARRLGMTPCNVDYHLRRLRKLFSVHNRVQLVSAAMAGEFAG